MKEASWQECLETHTALAVSPDRARAKSLIETAGERVSIIIEINERNCNFVFEDYYTSILEMLQAIVISKGYNVSNHICLGHYIRDVLKNEGLYRLFDDVRYKRNSLTYYGKRMDFETAKESIEKCKRIVKELRGIINSQIP